MVQESDGCQHTVTERDGCQHKMTERDVQMLVSQKSSVATPRGITGVTALKVHLDSRTGKHHSL
jgi:hypothetical protein